MPAGTAVASVEAKLKSRYGSNTHAIYGTLNKIGLMRGSKPTKKGLKKPRMGRAPSRAPAHTAVNY